MSSITYIYILWAPTSCKKFEKSNEPILRKRCYRAEFLEPSGIKMTYLIILSKNPCKIAIVFFIRWLMHLSITFYCAWNEFVIRLYTKCWCQRSLLVISQAFDKVWRANLYKLESYGVKGKRSQCSNWERSLSGVPQGSALDPPPSLFYVNDLSARPD